MDLDIFRGVVAFVAVAQEKSIRKAAIRLRVSAAAVSKSVTALETETGVKLFVRGPREMALTTEGDAFLSFCRPAVVSVESGRSALESRKRKPQGELVVSAPFVAAPLFAGVIALLRERYPRLTFTLRVTDRVVRLGEEGIDVALRVGQLDDSRLVARKVRETRLVTVASPRYLGRAGTPVAVEDLDSHACIGSFAPKGKPFEWLFRSGPRAVDAFMLVDHGPSLIDAAIGGLGVTQIFDFMAEPLIREGKLVAVLADQVARGPDIHAVCAPGRQSSARVRAALDAIAEALAH